MRLVAIVGMRLVDKRLALQTLAKLIQARAQTLTFLDNGEQPTPLEGVERVRLAGGCVCCGLAGQLIRSVNRVTSDYALLLTSAQADPHVLRFALDNWRGARLVAILDEDTRAQYPYLAEKYAFYADVCLDPGAHEANESLLQALL